MPQREYASKKYALKGLCLKGTPFDSYAKRGDASKKYALKGKCLKKLCPKGTMPPRTMPFYCTTKDFLGSTKFSDTISNFQKS